MRRIGLAVGLVLGLFAASLVAQSQAARKVYRIGLLGSFEISDMIGPQPRNPFVNALL